MNKEIILSTYLDLKTVTFNPHAMFMTHQKSLFGRAYVFSTNKVRCNCLE